MIKVRSSIVNKVYPVWYCCGTLYRCQNDFFDLLRANFVIASCKNRKFRIRLLTGRGFLFMINAQLEFRSRTDIVAIEIPEYVYLARQRDFV